MAGNSNQRRRKKVRVQSPIATSQGARVGNSSVGFRLKRLLHEFANWPLVFAGVLAATFLMICDLNAVNPLHESLLDGLAHHSLAELAAVFTFAVWGTTVWLAFPTDEHMIQWFARPFVGLGYHAANYGIGVFLVAATTHLGPQSLLAVGLLCILATFFTQAYSVLAVVTAARLPRWFPILRAMAFLLSVLLAVMASAALVR